MRRCSSSTTHFGCGAVWASCGFSTSRLLRGLEQIDDVPTSTSRKPTGVHRGPGKRQTSKKETAEYQFIKKWDFQMREQWDEYEPFKGLPKPKKQFGNEAAEVIWPYAMLIEKLIKVHPFTKSIYVYYPHKQLTEQGRIAADVAKRFARKSLIPITFHNSQCYVETEMLLEHSDTPWIVVHCVDNRHELIPVKPATSNVNEEEEALLAQVIKVAESLGSSVQDPKACTRLLNERPLQNQYLRINYQWFGDTPDERMSHLVRWDYDPKEVEPKIQRRSMEVMDWLSHDGNLPNHSSVRINVARESKRLVKPKTTQGVRSFFNSSSRANSRYSKFGGTAGIS